MGETAPRQRTVITAASKPAMPPYIKLRHDAGRNRWIILAPERLFDPDEIAVEVLKLCDGARTVGEVVEQLAKDTMRRGRTSRPTSSRCCRTSPTREW